jgi:hypothetical protein
MPTTPSPSCCPPDYFSILHRLLDLLMQTAETASTEGNHRVVIQAIREGSRLITLILKMTSPGTPSNALDKDLMQAFGGLAFPAAANLENKWEKSGKLPKKTTPNYENIKKNHKDKQLEKIFFKDAPGALNSLNTPNPALKPGAWLAALDSGQLDIHTLNCIGAGREIPAPLKF